MSKGRLSLQPSGWNGRDGRSPHMEYKTAGEYLIHVPTGTEHLEVKNLGLCAILGKASSGRGRAGMSCSVARHTAAIFACLPRRAQTHARSFVARQRCILLFQGRAARSWGAASWG